MQSGYTYIYGIESAGNNKFLHIARAPNGQVLTAGSNPTAAWQFWTGRSWSAGESASARVMGGIVGASITEINKQYVLVAQEANPDLPFDPNLVAYTASLPTGPFAYRIYLYHPPRPGATSLPTGQRFILNSADRVLWFSPIT